MMRFAVAVLTVVLTVAGFADAEEKRVRRVAVPVVKIEKGAVSSVSSFPSPRRST